MQTTTSKKEHEIYDVPTGLAEAMHTDTCNTATDDFKDTFGDTARTGDHCTTWTESHVVEA